MFQIDAKNLPFVRTRSALLVLDLQNDFVSTGAILPVESPPDFVDSVVKLVPKFRDAGNIIWIRSYFEKSRPVNEPYGDSEAVVTDKELKLELRGGDEHLSTRPGLPSKLLEQHEQISVANGQLPEVDTLASDEENSIDETFLTIKAGHEPQVVLPDSPNTNFTQKVLSSINGEADLIFQKTWYSAFKDGHLVQILRAKFVTEIFICGALTNISVFATAMDAARHGYSITLVDDCLGYRSKARHDESIRRLVEFTGCEVISSDELMEELKEKAKMRQAPPRVQQAPRARGTNSGLEDLLSNLNLKGEGPPVVRRAGTRSSRPPAMATMESTGSSKDVAEESDSQETQLPPRPAEGDGKKRERVKTKIKTRRRPSSTPKDGDAGPSTTSSETVPHVAARIVASEALDQLPRPAAARRKSSSPNPSAAATQGATTKVGKSTIAVNPVASTTSNMMAVHPDYAVEEEDEPSDDEGTHTLCEGDTTIINNLLPEELAGGIFETVRDEVRWQTMSHQGGEVPRLVAVQGAIAKDRSMPIYRHPADESPPLLPFSPTVSLIQAQVEKRLGHSVNHVLIQYYRDGTDYISEHSDKTLDIVQGTFIANVSLGAQRTMVFRTKKAQKDENKSARAAEEPRISNRAPLPHNSMCKMGLRTNMRWLHGIRQDKRMASEKMAEELAYQGGRISLTFRQIGTFLDKDQQKIWGQGAVAKTKDQARTVVNGDTPEAEKMIRAFGKENHSSQFDWKAFYGEGFDVLHISNTPKLYLSGDVTADVRVKIYLAEYGVAWIEGKLSPGFHWKDGKSAKGVPEIPEILPITFVDNDLGKSTIIGDIAIMLYLDAVYGPKTSTDLIPTSPLDIARTYTRLQQCETLIKKWRTEPFSVKPFRRELALWEGYAMEGPYIAGSKPTLVDFAFFSIVEEIRAEWKNADYVHNIVAWYFRIRHREMVMKAMGPLDKFEAKRVEDLAANEGVYKGIKKWD